MPTMNMIQALNSALDVMLGRHTGHIIDVRKSDPLALDAIDDV